MGMEGDSVGSAGVQASAGSRTQPGEDILEVNRWQSTHIRDSLKQAEAGEFAIDDEVAAAFERWRS